MIDTSAIGRTAERSVPGIIFPHDSWSHAITFPVSRWVSPFRDGCPVSPDFDAGSREYLTVLTGDSEVYLWDVAERRRCVRRWKDEGGFRGAGRVLAGSGKGFQLVGRWASLFPLYSMFFEC